ncbi:MULTISPECIES: hypothetical protein [Thiorhodovibrio]|uniref:hypothetical protein n=1 Tax=Thiorhodovibrio TaxID=61593 RepID=UPI0019149540|nr:MULTISPECIES: hypothetical protein [Thiorhodovibrio]WPL11366.1 hypothetical protein Thiosp_01099 [Thiorhodovibrio litoralis]WPL14035.1 hypothetical protein Thiosp_03866 [Thiorhodovibrio litoralis]
MAKSDSTDPVGIEDGLTDQQRRGAELAAAGWSGVDIAGELNVRPETVSRWRKLPAWQAAVDGILSEARAVIGSRVLDLSERALDQLELLVEYRHNPTIRLRACIEMVRLAGVGRAVSGGQRSSNLPTRAASGE